MIAKLMAATFAVLLIAASPAQAKHHRHHKVHHHKSVERLPAVATEAVYDNSGYIRSSRPEYRTSDRLRRNRTAFHDRGQVIGGRPAGCPRASCGCVASIFTFGRIIPELNLAENWIRKFPQTSPAPGMAAARKHHVFVLISHTGGNNWLVHDGNSGHGMTREHVRSVAGYAIVNPHGSRYANR
jgi:hypothetical protein